MTKRARLSATVDSDVLAAARHAVREGGADSLSRWVNDALARQVEHDRRMRALDEFVRAYEEAHGEITTREILEATRRTRARAEVIRPRAARRRRGVAS
ncbi:MAG TPA: hypothetical protein VFM93_00310 [Candidatus Limnocylindria bacterium]|nr:hypothetical protein [Candidatus Limnocylindria bacterium]